MNETVTQTAENVTNFGMMATTASFFLLLSAALMIACFRWFKSIINSMLRDYRNSMEDLLRETRSQNEMLQDISEGLKPETQLRIKNLSGVFFDYATEKACRMIKKIREENHIVDKEATRKKILSLVTNLHEDRNSRFDYFTYRGRPLSAYTTTEWISWVAEIIETEVYAEKQNNGRAYTNICAVYDRIKIDFYHRMNSL